ncbi:MAG: hypothetical protein UW73_C0028G0004 [Microgenomates group bacterium GW2011_GWB1_44_8]|nr:MAG: hypothetical protein UW73_C0028G0004 [Microgenomates group bacterium GW2011_GWB1_44_8]
MMAKPIKQKEFEVAGVKLQKKHYPVIYKSVQRNQALADEKLKALADEVYEGDVGSAAQALESDLEHSQ